ncbi:hypothetical protein C2E20_8786 [Micractinium conductrix]|uniref:F-box domain-containing protein n=1 Tax=Micractinium conductrix TaxID=554055 RepID=A0A2P6V0H8_9CHLO|nr:hypothetical protein C2E20_8786 [Micractinium conductrix]|eukprot:PSC67554.1 hypothetical protein C2E20_8786 [Micractinium conductrix]
MARCLLLPSLPLAGEAFYEAPAGLTPEELLEQACPYEAALASGGRMLWGGAHCGLASHNALASSLAHLQVCGDAVVVLPPAASAATALLERVELLAAKHHPQQRYRRNHPHDVPVNAAGEGSSSSSRSSGGGSSTPQPTTHKRRQEKQLLLHNLLRRSRLDGAVVEGQVGLGNSETATSLANEAAAAAAAAAGQPSVAAGEPAAVPSAPPAAALPAAPPTPRAQPRPHSAADWGQQERAAACQRLHERRQRARGQEQPHHEAAAFGGEPRQALLWTIAGRATSLSWQGGQAGAAPAAPAASHHAAPAAPAVAQQPERAEAAPPPGLAAAGAGGGVPYPQAVPALATAPALPPHPPARQRASLDCSPWSDLPSEMLAAVLAAAGHSPHTARAASQVCRGWREGLGQERATLQLLRFTRLTPQPPAAGGSASGSSGSGRDGTASSSAGSGSSGSDSSSSSIGPRLPWLVERATKAGNVAATVTAARHLEGRLQQRQGPGAGASAAGTSAAAAATWYAYGGGPAAAGAGGAPDRVVRAGRSCGSEAEVERAWARAAKLGHPEGQWRVGYWHYKGLMGLPHDGEEALLQLSRCARQLSAVVAASEAAAVGAGGDADADGAAPAVRLPPLMSAAECRAILAQAAHILGYIFLDGEGTKSDLAAAIRWFKEAERHGCQEAGRVLGSLFNTGIYA